MQIVSLGKICMKCQILLSMKNISKCQLLNFLPSMQSVNKRFVCVEVLRPSQPNGVMSSMVSLPNHMFTGQT